MSLPPAEMRFLQLGCMLDAHYGAESEFADNTHYANSSLGAIRPITQIFGKGFFLSIHSHSDRYQGHSHNLYSQSRRAV
jgi:hypothetical protein